MATAPLDLTLNGGRVPENNAVGTVVGQFSTSDLDAGDSFTYSLVTGGGDEDNAKFTVQGDRLIAQQPFDYEFEHQLQVRVRSLDSSGLTVERPFTITVTDLDDLTPLSDLQPISQAEPEFYVELGARVDTLTDQSTSADGRYYVFSSAARNLIPNQYDHGSNEDVFLRDRVDGTTRLVSRGVDGPESAANGESRRPRISADGRYVAFESTATNLVVGQSSSPHVQIYLYDTTTGSITLVSRASTAPTTPSNNAATLTDISDDGARIVYTSRATNLVAGQTDSNAADDVFLFDRTTSSTRLVSRASSSATTTGNGRSHLGRLSGDGQWVAFVSAATNHVAGVTDSNSADDVWLYDVAASQVSLVSRSTAFANVTANGASSAPSIDGTGGRVAFESLATNLVSGQNDANSALDVFVHRRSTGVTTLVSRSTASASTAGNGRSNGAAISADGLFVAYQSTAKTLTSGLGAKTRTDEDVFLYSVADATNTLVSHESLDSDQAGDGRSFGPVISDDGRFVAYLTQASDVVDGMTDANGALVDAVVYDALAGTSGLASGSADDPLTSGDAAVDSVAISGQGDFVYFTSAATNLATPVVDDRQTRDAFVFDLASGLTETVNRSDLLSPASTSTGGGSGVWSEYSISDDDRYWVFTSTGVDLAPATVGAPPVLGVGVAQVYLFDRFTFARTLVSHAASSASTVANGASSLPMVSGGGEYVLFQSLATNLVTGQVDANAAADVFLYSLASGQTQLVSRSSAGPTTAANGASRPLGLTADGRYALFASTATNLVTGQVDTNGGEDVFLFDRQTGTTRLISQAAGLTTTAANAPTSFAAINESADVIALAGTATNLVAGQIDTNAASDVFVFDLSNSQMSLVSRSTAGVSTTANGASTLPRLSKFGGSLAFLSTATNLIAGVADTNNAADVFLVDLLAETALLVSHVPNNPQQAANAAAIDVAIGADGQFLVYSSLATNLVEGQIDANAGADLFFYDAFVDSSALVTARSGSTVQTASGGVGAFGISDDGLFVAFDSTATGLVAQEPGPAGSREVYHHNAANQTTQLVTRRPSGSTAKDSRLTGIGATGEWIGLTSDADNLVDWDYNRTTDALAWTLPFVIPVSVPVDIAITGATVHEGLPVGTQVGQLSALTADEPDVEYLFEFAAGDGGDDNGSFRITGDRLETGAIFDRQTKSSYQVRLRATDTFGQFVEKAFTIRITGDNVAPTDLTLSRLGLFENLRGATVGTLDAIDEDLDDSHLFTVSDNRFLVTGDTLKLKTAFFLQRSTATTVTLTVTATDTAEPPNEFSKQFTLTVLANPAPWQNPDDPLDVNPDTFVVPQDALFIINELNEVGSHALLPPIEGEEPPPPFFDVDGDNFVAPIDALLIINHLNALSGSEGEGEPPTDPLDGDSASSAFAAAAVSLDDSPPARTNSVAESSSSAAAAGRTFDPWTAVVAVESGAEAGEASEPAGVSDDSEAEFDFGLESDPDWTGLLDLLARDADSTSR